MSKATAIRNIAMTSLLLSVSLSACSGATSTSAIPATNDVCEPRQTNLEYSDCVQNLAARAQVEVDATFARAQLQARQSDQEASGDGTGNYRSWLVDALNDSQSEWVQFSDRQCLFEGRLTRGGTGTRAMVAQCKRRLSLERVKDLENMIHAIKSY